jgi:competence protein ComEC
VIGKLEGFVESVEERRDGARLVVLVHAIAGVDPERRPTRVRVTLRTLGALKPGQFAAGTARLLPPPEAAWPGGYDFAREAYFRGIGAVGSLVGAVEVKAPPAPLPWRLTVAAAVDEARNAMTARIAEAVGGPAGAVAAALVHRQARAHRRAHERDSARRRHLPRRAVRAVVLALQFRFGPDVSFLCGGLVGASPE